MFCPSCRDEFRRGFTRCGRCNVDLVEELPEATPASRRTATAPACGVVRMVEYCGYLSLDEARGARDQLREERIRSEIVVRESPGAAWDEPAREEYWLRVDTSCLAKIAAVLGEIPQAEESGEREEEDTGFACGECGQHVAAAETFCPKCGAQFDD
jgi:hypothetical protein